MANAIYTAAKATILAGGIAYLTANIKVTLCDAADDTPNAAADDFYDDVASASRVATSGNFASKTATNGQADAADITFSSVTGDPSEHLIVWRDTGTESTSDLIALFDTATGLPVTPNGGNIGVTWGSYIYGIAQ